MTWRPGQQNSLSLAVDDYRWLVSEAAANWLALAQGELAERREANPALVSRLRRDLTAERVHLVLEQVELRQRARAKFSLAERMFFTRQALEQATDEQIADCKARRFLTGGTVLDLCCGIGGDLMALARRTLAIGVDLDPVAALLAETNAVRCGGSRDSFQVLCADALQADITSVQSWHCDPDRRASGKRTSRLEFGEPSREQLEQCLLRNPNAAIKLAPAAEAPANWCERAELEWLGSRGECRQQVAWFGGLARYAARHAATIVDAHGSPYTVSGMPGDSVPLATQPGRYLFEPDATVLAAKLTNALCQQHELKAIAAGIAYLTGDQLVRDPALDVFEILDVLPLDRKQLKAYCRQHQIGRLEVKKRGVEVEPARLRKEIVSDGDEGASLLIAPALGQTRVFVTRRVVG